MMQSKLPSLYQKADVCLIVLPFSGLTRPSIGTGILKSVLNNTEIKPAVIYANLLFAERIGLPYYRRMTEFIPENTNVEDWVFSEIAFPNFQPDTNEYFKIIEPQLSIASEVDQSSSFDQVLQTTSTTIRNELLEIKQQAKIFIEELAHIIVEKNVKIVGCSSIFSQQVASLALLRKVKELCPEIITMIGGFNCAGELGLTAVMEFPWVDLIFSGEADASFYPLCQLLLSEGPNVAPEKLPNGAFNKERATNLLNSSIKIEDAPEAYGMTKDLNTVPEPDYDDYFETLKATSFYELLEPNVAILLETSRGCWWHKCVFCGLNILGKIYRTKDYKKVLKEITHCTERYNTTNIEFVDNILSMDYFSDLIPAISSLPKKYNIFFETKANLSRDHLEMLVDANIKWIQPGLECLNDHMLDLFDKGTSTLINLRLLKHAIEYGIDIYWHLLCNFPGEKIEWIDDLANDIRLFHHLQPPATLSPIVFQKFSKYLDDPEAFNLQLELFDSFKFIYPLPEKKLTKLAFYFRDQTYGMQVTKNSEKYQHLTKEIKTWQLEFNKTNPASLIMEDREHEIIIHDTRMCAIKPKFTIDGLEADIIRTTEAAVKKSNLNEHVNQIHPHKFTLENLDSAVINLKNKHILYEHNGKLLALPSKGRIPPTKHPMKANLNFTSTK